MDQESFYSSLKSVVREVVEDGERPRQRVIKHHETEMHTEIVTFFEKEYLSIMKDVARALTAIKEIYITKERTAKALVLVRENIKDKDIQGLLEKYFKRHEGKRKIRRPSKFVQLTLQQVTTFEKKRFVKDLNRDNYQDISFEQLQKKYGLSMYTEDELFELLENQLEENFEEDLREIYRSTKAPWACRSTLPKYCKFRFNGFHDYLAWLRTCNYSQRLRMLNRMASPDIAQKKDVIHCEVEFGHPGISVVVKSTLSTTTDGADKIFCSRADKIEELGSYPAIMELLESIKKKAVLTAKDIGGIWLDLAQNKSVDSIVNKFPQKKQAPIRANIQSLCNVFHLLFGVEVMRNPASLVHIIMLISLVSKGFDLDLTELPMTLDRAVSISRRVNAKKGYVYDYKRAVNCDKDQWIQKERELYERWTNAYPGSDLGQHVKNFCFSNNAA